MAAQITIADVGKAVWAVRGIDHVWQRDLLDAVVEAVSNDKRVKVAGLWYGAHDVRLAREPEQPLGEWDIICPKCGLMTSRIEMACEHCGYDTRLRCLKCGLPFRGEPPLCPGHRLPMPTTKARPAGGQGHGHLRNRRMAWQY